GRNVRCFVAAGGTRLDKQAGHPDGAIVRVGFYKENKEAWFFDGIAPGTDVTIVLENVRFNREGHPNVPSILQHNKYLLSDLEACGLSGDAMDQYNTWSATDDMAGKLPPEKTRLGLLGGRTPRATVTQDETGACRLVARIPYGSLRHLQDPWTLETPGSFFEPEHFHVEFEALPDEVWNEAEHGPKAVTTPPSP
ncbi:MAG: hypothetical protein KDA28_15935, partial [Phycisphaerales bacterium]|nr:hypothetical protein [Phycisphaerales bacterium]